MHFDQPLEIELPVKTVSEGNRHEHWRKRYQRRKVQQDTVGWALVARFGRRPPPAPVHVSLKRIAPRRLDPGNLEFSFKAVQDAVAKWLGVDDGDERSVSWSYSQERRGTRQYSVVATIFPRDSIVEPGPLSRPCIPESSTSCHE